ncbi:fungal-specific transcription factor domain-containing protein [Mycena alexandri]|uniref:Fungal-specific transcription factor domain-containing protein n=1 Tax=Mycena alexandri TaxID=1745969 RepID=A0AAD6THR6_9AGAR|nr:fungal-specific transcription factor domain-containing protein [Mycena alexandri]
MPSDDTETHELPRPKRRRLRGACDICRKQKSRCDSAEMPGGKCSKCIQFLSECTHSGNAKGGSSSANLLKKSPLTAQEHVKSILSGSTEYSSGDPGEVYQVLVAVARYAQRLEEALSTTTAVQSSTELSPPSDASETVGETDTESDDGVLVDETLAEPLRQITRDISSNRFYGKSSSIHFIRFLMDVKTRLTGDNNLKPQTQRPEFWNTRPWEVATEIFIPQLFPEPWLMTTLIDLYFSEVNPTVYLLHEISFRKAVQSGLHLHDVQFGAVVLAVSALGAKFSEDPRVFLEGTDSEHSAGWKWFQQVRRVPNEFFTSPSLFQLQLNVLIMLYLASSSIPEETWAIVGIGLRMAYDVGANRRIRSNHGDAIEAELYKRAFYILAVSDTSLSLLLGRPRSIVINDLDLDLLVPLEGEDPIVNVYPALLLNLVEIWGHIQDAIYPVKHKDQSYQEVVAELDSALNRWVDSIPDELRWDPAQPDLIRLNQSACLYVVYYHVQISLHRPFIPSPGTHSSLSTHPRTSFPSLAICANAARSCAHVMDIQTKRGVGPLHNPQVISAIFDSAVILLMNVFHRSRPSTDQSVNKCMDVLRAYERRWQIAGRNLDILEGMLNFEEPSTVPAFSLKRSRSSEQDTPSTSSDSITEPRLVAGSKRVLEVAQDIEQLQVGEQEIERLLFLPLHTQDLGRLPIYESFDFDSIFRSDAFPESVELDFGVPLPSDPLANELYGTSWDEWPTSATPLPPVDS